MTPEIR